MTSVSRSSFSLVLCGKRQITAGILKMLLVLDVPQYFGSLLYVHVLSLDVRDDKGRTPLDTAIENNTSAAFYLIDHIPGMCDDKERGKLLCRACNSGDLDMVKKLVEEHLVDPKGWYVYCFTIMCITLHYHMPSVLCRCEG